MGNSNQGGPSYGAGNSGYGGWGNGSYQNGYGNPWASGGQQSTQYTGGNSNPYGHGANQNPWGGGQGGGGNSWYGDGTPGNWYGGAPQGGGFGGGYGGGWGAYSPQGYGQQSQQQQNDWSSVTGTYGYRTPSGGWAGYYGGGTMAQPQPEPPTTYTPPTQPPAAPAPQDPGAIARGNATNRPQLQRAQGWLNQFNQMYPGMGQRGPGDFEALYNTKASDQQVGQALQAIMQHYGNNPTQAFTVSHDAPLTYAAQMFQHGYMDPSKWDWKGLDNGTNYPWQGGAPKSSGPVTTTPKTVQKKVNPGVQSPGRPAPAAPYTPPTGY